MARKPAPLELAGGKGLRQRIWDRIRLLSPESDFALLDLVIGDECTATARDYVVGLARAGYLRIAKEAVTNGPLSRRTGTRYVLNRDAGAEAPRVRKDGTPVTMGLAQEQMWRTLRTLKGDINARELAAHAGTPAVPVAERAAGDYLRNLACAAYLRETKRGHGTGRGGIQSRYQIINDTGPRPPMVCRADAIYDPNLARIVWTRHVTDEDAIYGS